MAKDYSEPACNCFKQLDPHLHSCQRVSLYGVHEYPYTPGPNNFMPRCACASEVYGSVFVCLWVVSSCKPHERC